MIKLTTHMAMAEETAKRLTPERLAILWRSETLLEHEKDELFEHIAAVEAELAEAKAVKE